MQNVRHTITGPIGNPMEPYDGGIEAKITDEFPGRVELSRAGHEFIVSFVLEHDFDFYRASDPEDEDGIFGILRIIGLNSYTMIELCQAAHRKALYGVVRA